MKKYVLFIFMSCFSQHLFGQYNITQMSDFAGSKRYAGNAFTVNGKGYYGAGADFTGMVSNVYKDFWKYLPLTDTWAPIADLPIQRYSAMDFSLGGYGYVGTGWTYLGGGQVSDFYKYDPVADTWTSVAPLPGTGRYTGVGLSNGYNGYGGFGYAPLRNDFYEYNAPNDVWTTVSAFPSTVRQSLVGFTINEFVYVGCGYTYNPLNDFWRYDPNSQTWSQISDYPVPQYAGVGFGYNGKGIVGLGRDDLSYFDMLYEYDPATNIWTQIGTIPTGGREASDAFVVGDCSYIICGRKANGSYTKEVWRLCGGFSSLGDQNSNSTVSIAISGMNQSISADIKSLSSDAVTLSIYDLSGRSVYSQSFRSATQVKIPVGKGIYVYNLTVNSVQYKSGKVLVN